MNKKEVDLILNSKAYARMIDKTQVVYLVADDHLTSRSLHVQLVSHLSRRLAERLSLNVDLVEAIALGHDLGHPPFGHEGEEYLSELSFAHGGGYFVHNVHSCHLLDPLALSVEVLDGILCHSGGLVATRMEALPKEGMSEHLKERRIRIGNPRADLQPMTLEGCLVRLCDKICYIGKDLEDGIRLGLIKKEEIPPTSLGFSHHEIVMACEASIILNSDYKSIAISEEVFQGLQELRRFNFARIYFHPKLKVESARIKRAYTYLFEWLLQDVEEKREQSVAYRPGGTTVEMVVDYLAGMTDRFFIRSVKECIVPHRIEVG